MAVMDLPGAFRFPNRVNSEQHIDGFGPFRPITGGMLPQVETCIYALEAGVQGVVILAGKVEHAVLLELFTAHGAGSLIRG